MKKLVINIFFYKIKLYIIFMKLIISKNNNINLFKYFELNHKVIIILLLLINILCFNSETIILIMFDLSNIIQIKNILIIVFLIHYK